MGQIRFDAALGSALVYCCFMAAVFAQGATGTVRGQVIDQDSAVGVQGTTVTLSHLRTGMTRTTTTNAADRFQLQLAPGAYVLRTSASDYSAVTIEQVMVNVGAVVNLSIPVEQTAIEQIVTYEQRQKLQAMNLPIR